MITTTITNEQEIDGLFRPLTAGGHPAPIDGDVAWEILDGNSTLGATSEGGQVQTFRSEDGTGTTHFKGTADADLGTGFQPIGQIYEVIVIPAGAAAVGASFDEPRIKT